MNINYQDIATFVVVSTGAYGNTKNVVEQHDVSVVFVQSTDFVRSGFQENVDADAICYPDPYNEFVLSKNYRLEGLYILMPLYGASDSEGWYKVESVSVNRDHLLTNTVDNVELLLKKTRPIPNVS